MFAHFIDGDTCRHVVSALSYFRAAAPNLESADCHIGIKLSKTGAAPRLFHSNSTRARVAESAFLPRPP